MPVTLKLEFPAGRYHATPWGKHVNEGVPEWPPSPWRLLRALIAVWKRSRPDYAAEWIQEALEPLLAPPVYLLPPHRVAHTRHYMPWEKKGPADRALIFDTFVAVSREDQAFISWPDAELGESHHHMLADLVRNLSTLGRAESWVEAELLSTSIVPNCTIADASELDPMPVFCADPSTAFANDYYPKHDPKKLKKGLRPEERLFDCPSWHLCLDTQTIHAERWPRVPGGAWVNYTRPQEAAAGAQVPHRSATYRRPTVARFLLDGPVLPLTTDTIRIAEAVRSAAMSQFIHWCRNHPQEAEHFRRTDDPEQFASTVLSGKAADGRILTSCKHAAYLPSAEPFDLRHLARVAVYAPCGFTEGELAALASVKRLYGEEFESLRLQLIGVGGEKDFTEPLFGESAEWVSATPYLGPAHIGRRAKGRFMRKAISREWRRLVEQVPNFRGVQLREIIELPYNDRVWRGNPAPFEYRRARRKHGSDYRPCGIYRLSFSEPICGPLSLGYASHFGLGQFRPA